MNNAVGWRVRLGSTLSLAAPPLPFFFTVTLPFTILTITLYLLLLLLLLSRTTQFGFTSVMAHPDSINQICLCLTVDPFKVQRKVGSDALLSSVCPASPNLA